MPKLRGVQFLNIKYPCRAQSSSFEEKSATGDSSNFSLSDYAAQYTQMRDKYLQAAKVEILKSRPEVKQETTATELFEIISCRH